MKEKSKKQFTELSDQELEKVTGGYLTAIHAAAYCNFEKCRELGKETDKETCECI